MKFELWHAFVIGAILSWGTYVPMIHEGQSLIGGVPSKGALRAFLCVGLAYFLTAIVIPLALFGTGTAGEEFKLTNSKGLIFSTIAGVCGAAGALCIILSIKNNGKPMFIAPLVFAGAPIMNAIVSLIWHPPAKGLWPGPLFFIGIVLAALGAGLVLYSKGELDKRSREMKQQVAKVETAPPTTH